MKNENQRKSTTLSDHVWKLKENNKDHSIKWKVISKASSYSKTTKICSLCLEEKYFIIRRPDMSSINKRQELGSFCRHRNKHLLINF